MHQLFRTGLAENNRSNRNRKIFKNELPDNVTHNVKIWVIIARAQPIEEDAVM